MILAGWPRRCRRAAIGNEMSTPASARHGFSGCCQIFAHLAAHVLVTGLACLCRHARRNRPKGLPSHRDIGSAREEVGTKMGARDLSPCRRSEGANPIAQPSPPLASQLLLQVSSSMLRQRACQTTDCCCGVHGREEVRILELSRVVIKLGQALEPSANYGSLLR